MLRAEAVTVRIRSHYNSYVEYVTGHIRRSVDIIEQGGCQIAAPIGLMLDYKQGPVGKSIH